jgi:hypothetical protein
MAKIPICLQCIHYYITFDQARPYGCRAMRFKSKKNPAQVVFENSGIICQMFSTKKKPDNGSGSSRVA